MEFSLLSWSRRTESSTRLCHQYTNNHVYPCSLVHGVLNVALALDTSMTKNRGIQFLGRFNVRGEKQPLDTDLRVTEEIPRSAGSWLTECSIRPRHQYDEIVEKSLLGRFKAY